MTRSKQGPGTRLENTLFKAFLKKSSSELLGQFHPLLRKMHPLMKGYKFFTNEGPCCNASLFVFVTDLALL